MSIFIATLLTVIVLAVVAYPLLVQRGRQAAGSIQPVLEAVEQLRRARDRTYEEIRALQQERFMRDISDEEYQAQLRALRAQAARLIQQQHSLQSTLDATTEQAGEGLELRSPQDSSE